MKVIAAKHITESAREWLCFHGTAIDQMRGLVIVFLPDNLTFHRSEWREVSHFIARADGIPAVFVEPDSDDVRQIYMRGDEDGD